MAYYHIYMFRKRVYLDYASVTPVDPRVNRLVGRVSRKIFGNPSSLHKEGVAAAAFLGEARASIARLMHGHADEIIFTGSGTEANNLAILGAYNALKKAGKSAGDLHIVTSTIEHPSVLEVVRNLEARGAKATYVSVDQSGVIDLEALKKAITPQTFLVSIMMVNNEVGTLQPIREIAKIVRHARKISTLNSVAQSSVQSHYPLFHTDASQAAACFELNTENLGVDMITLDSHKVFGPRGVGMLWMRRGTPVEAVMFGGKQENGLRSATENLPGIVGFAKALAICADDREREVERLSILREQLKKAIIIVAPNAVLNGSALHAPHILNMSFPEIDNEFLLLQLDAKGVACSTRSSCLKDEPGSYVLTAMGLPTAVATTSLRFSLGRWSCYSDIRALSKALKMAISIQNSVHNHGLNKGLFAKNR